MKEIRRLDRTEILKSGDWLSVEKHRVQFPNGQIIDDWSWIVTPSYATVIAVTTANEVVCFRQSKYALDGVVLAPVAGYINGTEEPLDTAKRELAEEAGLQSDTWKGLGSYVVDSNRGVAVAHLFLATEAIPVTQPPPPSDDLEEQELVLLSLDAFRQAIVDAKFGALSWTAAGALALLHLEATRPGDRPAS